MDKRRIAKTIFYTIEHGLVFWCQRSRRNSDGVNPNVGAK